MKIGIIGLGSIGQRHARMLFKLGINYIVALRSKKGTLKELPDDLKFIKQVFNEEEFLDELDGVIVSNPTSLHVSAALPALKKGIKTFIEKPITASVADTQLLEQYKELIIVGYCLRFSGYIKAVKDFLENDRLGKLYKVSFYRSFYLPKWHPYADYREEYTAKKELGGGVIRTLSHEIDLMHYLFGKPAEVIGLTDKISDLEIDTDDFCFFSCKMDDGSRVNFEMDFLSPVNSNSADFIGEKGKLSYDLKSVIFTTMTGVREVVYTLGENEFEDMYRDQMVDFVNFIDQGQSENCSFLRALDVLEIIENVDK